MKRSLLLLTLCLVLLIAGCAPPSGEPSGNALETMVAATLNALTPLPTPALAATLPPVQPTFTPIPSNGEISGRVCYPSGVSTMKVYLQDMAEGSITEIAVASGAAEFTFNVAPGTYHLFAWAADFSASVAYTDANHYPANINVGPGAKLSNVDICDLFPAFGSVPYPPGYSPQAVTGTLAGSIYGYPGNASERLTVVAFNKGTGYWYYFKLAPGVRYYSISDLPPGTYQIVAYDPNGLAGGTGPTLAVVAGQTTVADINNWAGSFPANPVP